MQLVTTLSSNSQLQGSDLSSSACSTMGESLEKVEVEKDLLAASNGGALDRPHWFSFCVCVQGVEEMMNHVDKKYFFAALRSSSLCQARCCETAESRVQLQNWYAIHLGIIRFKILSILLRKDPSNHYFFPSTWNKMKHFLGECLMKRTMQRIDV